MTDEPEHPPSLTAWLREQLDEDEAGLNQLDPDFRLYADSQGRIAVPEEKWADGTDRLPNHHNIWSPILDRQERLTELKARKAILDLYDEAAKAPALAAGDREHTAYTLGLYSAIVLIAQPYADRDDRWKEEWSL